MFKLYGWSLHTQLQSFNTSCSFHSSWLASGRNWGVCVAMFCLGASSTQSDVFTADTACYPICMCSHTHVFSTMSTPYTWINGGQTRLTNVRWIYCRDKWSCVTLDSPNQFFGTCGPQSGSENHWNFLCSINHFLWVIKKFNLHHSLRFSKTKKMNHDKVDFHGNTIAKTSKNWKNSRKSCFFHKKNCILCSDWRI